jgi:osmotically-inducible protein OsmY
LFPKEELKMMGRDGWLLLSGAALGAGVMYMFDPDRGNRRRALCRDQLVSAGNRTGLYAGKLSRDLRNRAQGLVAETRARFRREEVTDDVLVNRVKAELGRHAVHHRALDITASGGRVTLRGPALAAEVDELLRAVASVRGVTGVEEQLDVHESAEGVSSLQGAVTAPAAG